MQHVYKIKIGKSRRQQPLGRPGYTWVILKQMSKKTRCETTDWIHTYKDNVQWQTVGR
jgi:hypothetical protein